ncbi:MAG: hypothetical protein WB678_00680 [Stellaceae bacterium]
MWAAIASIILGALGWGFARLVFEPMKEIVDLRREAQECLIIHGNLAKDAPAEDRRAASDTLRRIGAGFVSRHIAAHPWYPCVRWCCTWLGWDIHSAGALLISLGNSTQFEGYSLANLSPTVAVIRCCLKLGTPETPPMVRTLVDHAGGTGAIEPGGLP